MDRILAEAKRLGVRIEFGHTGPDERGRYYDAERLIHINPLLSRRQIHETCWHELAHAFYRDAGGHHPSIEERADRRAALMAVDPDLYAQAERVSDDIGHIAAELELTTRMIRVWRATWRQPAVA